MLNLVLWGIVIAAALGLEAAGAIDELDAPVKWHTLSYYIRKWVPRALILTGVLWLGHHFQVLP